jgi:predicted RNase H-like nuclease (RuvC/YqgF family)
MSNSTAVTGSTIASITRKPTDDVVKLLGRVEVLENRINLLEKTCDHQDRELMMYMSKMESITQEVKEH